MHFTVGKYLKIGIFTWIATNLNVAKIFVWHPECLWHYQAKRSHSISKTIQWTLCMTAIRVRAVEQTLLKVKPRIGHFCLSFHITVLPDWLSLIGITTKTKFCCNFSRYFIAKAYLPEFLQNFLSDSVWFCAVFSSYQFVYFYLAEIAFTNVVRIERCVSWNGIESILRKY